MNNRARHMQYRKSIYRKKRIKFIAVLSSLALVVLFILFLIVGTALHSKTSDSASGVGNKAPAQTDESTDTIAASIPIAAYALPLLSDGSVFSDRLAAVPEDASAVCIALNSTDGTLLYRSELSSTLSYLGYASDASSLQSSVSRIESRDLYISALLYVPSFSEENDLLRDVYLTSWCSVAVEAIRAGAQDCLLVARSANEDSVEKLCTLAGLIHEIEPNAIIGCVIPGDVIISGTSEVLIAKLAKSFNYLTLDTTDFKDDEDIAAYVEAKISQMQMLLIYYKMRVLLPSSDDAQTRQSYIDIVKKYNISSWQIKP